MGPGAYPLSPVIAVTALGRALRALGANADLGAAVEAAVSALEARPGPDRPVARGTGDARRLRRAGPCAR
jgi:hypothetical protein